MITITLDAVQTHLVAEQCARDILGVVVDRNLRLVGCRADLPPTFYLERKEFIGSVRYNFQRLRADRGIEIRGRDYVAKVNARAR